MHFQPESEQFEHGPVPPAGPIPDIDPQCYADMHPASEYDGMGDLSAPRMGQELRNQSTLTREEKRDIEMLGAMKVFEKLELPALIELRSLMSPGAFRGGEILEENLGATERFVVITDGSIELVVNEEEGGERVVGEGVTGDFFGELRLLGADPGPVIVRAKESGSFLSVDHDRLLAFLESHPAASAGLMRVLAQRISRIDKLLRESPSANVNEEMEEKATLGQRIADKFASVIGSWSFIIAQSAALATWVVLNSLEVIKPWDPYPYILLNLALSFQAAYAGPIIMMSQNRASTRDRLKADIDHQVNLNAERGVGKLLKKIDKLEQKVEQLCAEAELARKERKKSEAQ